MGVLDGWYSVPDNYPGVAIPMLSSTAGRRSGSPILNIKRPMAWVVCLDCTNQMGNLARIHQHLWVHHLQFQHGWIIEETIIEL